MILQLTFGHMFKKAERLILISQHMSNGQRLVSNRTSKTWSHCIWGFVEWGWAEFEPGHSTSPRPDETFVRLNMFSEWCHSWRFILILGLSEFWKFAPSTSVKLWCQVMDALLVLSLWLNHRRPAGLMKMSLLCAANRHYLEWKTLILAATLKCRV